MYQGMIYIHAYVYVRSIYISVFIYRYLRILQKVHVKTESTIVYLSWTPLEIHTSDITVLAASLQSYSLMSLWVARYKMNAIIHVSNPEELFWLWDGPVSISPT